MKVLLSLFLLSILSTIEFSQELTPAEARQRIEQVSPTPFPASSTVPQGRTDVEDEHLKGRVHVITDAEIDPKTNKTRMRWEFYYDEHGALTKKVLYDYRGNPFNITVYGYLDGKRVSKSASIRYGYEPLIVPLRPPNVDPPPADKRYDSSSVTKYDAAKRPVEELTYRNNGSLASRATYTYTGDTVERVSYDNSGKETGRSIEKYDSQGDLVELSIPHAGGMYGTSIYQYKFDEFDSKGNWLRATVTGKEGQYGGGQKDLQHVEIRTITYY